MHEHDEMLNPPQEHSTAIRRLSGNRVITDDGEVIDAEVYESVHALEPLFLYSDFETFSKLESFQAQFQYLWEKFLSVKEARVLALALIDGLALNLSLNIKSIAEFNQQSPVLLIMTLIVSVIGLLQAVDATQKASNISTDEFFADSSERTQMISQARKIKKKTGRTENPEVMQELIEKLSSRDQTKKESENDSDYQQISSAGRRSQE